jgi:hypothetical protein
MSAIANRDADRFLVMQSRTDDAPFGEEETVFSDRFPACLICSLL